MPRLFGFLSLCLCLILSLALTACEKSGATADEKKAALDAAEKTAREFEGVATEIIELKTAHGKMEVVIKEGVHPIKQADFIQRVGTTWYDAYPEGKKPTKNDMVQVWLWVKDKSEDEVGFIQVYSDQAGKMFTNFHHYKSQQAL